MKAPMRIMTRMTMKVTTEMILEPLMMTGNLTNLQSHHLENHPSHRQIALVVPGEARSRDQCIHGLLLERIFIP